jgi:dolichyl-phosphate-mannose--protein O-mannosyl transferase
MFPFQISKGKKGILLIFSFIIFFNISSCENMSEEDIKSTIESKTITYGSSLRIQNTITKFHLSSFGMNWSSGSGLQIITAVESDKEVNSLFTIKEGENYPIKINGDPVLCGDIIRLEHVSTGKNLHSHDFKSFVTNSQEACGFGDNGDGDVNDNFRISCYKQNDNETITGKTEFFLQHVPTQNWLYINYKTSMYDDNNCRGCPIRGQREVSLTTKKDKQCLWKVIGGIIFSSEKEQNEPSHKSDTDSDL